MGAFSYTILDDKGKVARGVTELPFDDVVPATRYMERQGNVVLSIAPLSPLAGAIVRLRMSLNKVRRKQLAEVLNNLSMLLSAGVPILSSLKDVQQDVDHPRLQQVLKFMCTDIENGQTFSQSLTRHPDVFSSLVVSMCRVGEETGRLDIMLEKSAAHIRHMDEIIGSTKRALLYPGILTVVVLGATAFWFLYVVPKIVELFLDLGVTLPLLTRILIAVSDWFQAYFLIVVGIAFFLWVALIIAKNRIPRVQYAWDWTLLRIPVVSMVIHTSLIARISEYLGILISAGIGVLRSMELIIESTGNKIYEERLAMARETIKNGRSLSSSLRRAEAMHPFAIRMIAVGEQTGNIDQQTEYVADVYRKRLEGLVEVLGKSLEPALLIFLGLLFGLILGGLLLPVYELASQIGS